MARKKSIIKIPFIKAKVNARTVFLMLGLVLFLGGILLFLSLLPFGSTIDGKLLSAIRGFLVERFGVISFFVPTLIILSATHVITHSKKPLLRPTITIGLFFIFLSLGGLLKGGMWGTLFNTVLKDNISFLGATLFFLTLLGIGIILFLDTSFDVLLTGLTTLIVKVFKSIKSSIDPALHPQQSPAQKGEFITDKKVPMKKKEEPLIEYVEDKRKNEKQPTNQVETGNVKSTQDLYIKPLTQSGSTWIFPPLNLLSTVKQAEADRGDVNYIAATIEKTLDSFGISARVAEQNKGPAVTQYCIEIKSGTRLSRITALANDLALAIAAPTGQVRIEAPIPGRAMVGIEIPNVRSQIVTLKSLLEHDVFTKNPVESPLQQV
ncbi:MAG: DNA translocase FtsK [Candidatus Roizmanbacteria bacterium]|nr:DNA translocase FtsK [Candidatus Roizmanbacteria bacterium]